LIQREIVGILSLSIPDDENTTSRFEDSEHYQNYARLIGNQFSIWLVNFTLREKLRNLSIRDPLTNLYNRRFMTETLHREMTVRRPEPRPDQRHQIDIDDFKTFNDSYGHEVARRRSLLGGRNYARTLSRVRRSLPFRG